MSDPAPTPLVLGDAPVTCPGCGDPVDVGENFCGVCGRDLRSLQAGEEGDPGDDGRRSLSCESCGAALSVDEQTRSVVCPFCKSPQVVAVPDRGAPPEFILGFANTEDVARDRFGRWVRKGGITVPGDLARAATLSDVRGVYVPFWSFSVRADTEYSCRIGEYWYRTETYTTIVNGKVVTRTRTVRETEWFPFSGTYLGYHNRYLVSGSKGLSQKLADAIMPYEIGALHRFRHSFLAGWMAEEPSVAEESALEVSNKYFLGEERKRVAAFLPGDTQRGLEVRTSFSQATSDLILLPLWILVYDYRGKRHQFVMNGQTGAMSGTRPKVYWKIVVLVLGILAVLAGCAGVLGLLGLIAGSV
jgi:hypothetical protein